MGFFWFKAKHITWRRCETAHIEHLLSANALSALSYNSFSESQVVDVPFL